MSIPKLTSAERSEALKKAQQMRSLRADVRRRLKEGALTLKEVLEQADDEIIGKMRVKYLLESLPQVGKITAVKIMNEIGIDEVRRVQGLGSRQKADLLLKFDK
ncbi:MAG: integration host factor [Firmicutes bacterium]|nr:integration host factor [Bacillota bacterium]MBQ3199869.1 integration host factor [Bacillota bacterium]